MKFKAGPIFALCFCLGAVTTSHPLRAASQETQNAAQPSPGNPPPTATTSAPSQLPTSQLATTPSSAPGSVNGTPGFWTQNYLSGDWDGFRDDLKKEGISFTPIWQGIIDDGLLDAILDVDLDPLSGGAIKDTTFHVEGFYNYGPSLSQKYVGDFSNTSNIAAYNTVRLGELWLQKNFWDKTFSIKVGNQAIDLEYFQSSSSALFINSTFGAFDLVANNVFDAPVYPLASPGVRFQYLPDPRVYVMAGVYGLDDNSFPTINNKYGTRFSLNPHSGMLVMSEIGYLLNQQPNDKGLQGSYRLGSFVDTGNSSTFASQANFANGTGGLQGAGTNYGIYGVVDQQIYSKGAQAITIFTRAGGAPSNDTFVDYYVDGGFNFTGFVPGRDTDVAGIAVARAHVSQDYSASQVAQGAPPSSAETVLEATYKVQLAPWWNVQPDIQYIITPGGVEGSPNAVVLGVRTTVAF
jgi:porin